MALILHIIFRYILHFFCAPGITLAVTFGLGFACRRMRHTDIAPYLPKNLWQTSWCAVGLVVPIAFMREPIDVAAGDWYGKSFFDFASWVMGSGITPWVIERLAKWHRDQERVVQDHPVLT